MFKQEDVQRLVDNNVFIINQSERIFKSWATLPTKDNQGQTVPLEFYKSLMPTLLIRRLPLTIVHPGVTLRPGERPKFEPAHVVGQLINVEFGIHPLYNIEGMLATFQVFRNYPKDDEAWTGVQNGEFTGVSPAGEIAVLETGMATWVAPSSFGLAPKPAHAGATIAVRSMAKSDLTPGGEKEKEEHPQLSNAEANKIDAQHQAMQKCASCGQPMSKECNSTGGNRMVKISMDKAARPAQGMAKASIRITNPSPSNISTLENLLGEFIQDNYWEGNDVVLNIDPGQLSEAGNRLAGMGITFAMHKAEEPIAKALPPVGTKPEEKETPADEKKETPAQQAQEKKEGSEEHKEPAPTEKEEENETVNKNGNEAPIVESEATAKTDEKKPVQETAQATPSPEEQAGVQKQVAQVGQKVDQLIAMASASEEVKASAPEEKKEPEKYDAAEAASKGTMAKIDASPKSETPRPAAQAHYQPTVENDRRKDVLDALSGQTQFDTVGYVKEQLAGAPRKANT